MRHHLLHEIHLAFARRSQRVQIYEPEVDTFGYDIILDDLITTRRIQLKTTLTTSSTSKWDIHKILLRPDIQHLNTLPFCPDSGGLGYMGGVILTSAYIEDDQIRYRYSYTDVLVICAIHAGVASPVNVSQRRSVDLTYRELIRPDYRPGKISVRMPCFWTFRSLRPVLMLAGFDLGASVDPRHMLLETVGRFIRDPHSEDTKLRTTRVQDAGRTIRDMMTEDEQKG